MRCSSAMSTVVVIAALASVAGPALSQGPAPATIPVGVIEPGQLPATVPLRVVADHLVVDATFGTDGPHAFMLDTGAPTDLAATLRDRVGGPTVSTIQTNPAGGVQVSQDLFPIEALSIGGLEVQDVIAIEGWVGPDSPLSCITENGLIGANAMAGAVWQLDYQAGTAIVAPSIDGLEHIEGAIALPFQPTPGISPTPIVAIPYGEAGFAFVVDTGSDAGLIATPAAFAAAGIEVPADAPTERSRLSGAAGDFDLTIPYVTTRLDLDGVAVEYPIAAVDIGTQGLGNMGNAFLGEFVVTFDWANRTIYLEPVAEDGMVSPPEHTTAGLGWDGMRVIVSRIQGGSPAAEAGLELGAVVSSVDGRDVSAATRDDFCALMTGAAPATIETEDGAIYDIRPDKSFFGS